MFRAATRRILDANGFKMCAEASDAAAATQAALNERPDLCLIAVLLPGDGIRATAEIAARVPSTTIVMLSASDDRDHLLASIRAGAFGYLLKDMDPGRIPDMLRGALLGEAAISPRMVTVLVDELRSRGERRLVVGERGRADLTAREWEVLELMGDGLTTRQIGERLFISPVTVRRHVSAILRKLGVSSREEAIAMVRGSAARPIPGAG